MTTTSLRHSVPAGRQVAPSPAQDSRTPLFASPGWGETAGRMPWLRRLRVGHLDPSSQVALLRDSPIFPSAEGSAGKVVPLKHTLQGSNLGYTWGGGVILIHISLTTNHIEHFCVFNFLCSLIIFLRRVSIGLLAFFLCV